MLHLPVERQALLRTFTCGGYISLFERHPPQQERRDSHPFLVAYFSIERESLLEQRVDHILVALGNKERPCQLRQRGGDPPLVAQLPKKRQALLEPGGSPGVFALLIVEQSMHEERPGDTIPVTQLSEEGEVFLQQDTCRSKIASSPGRHAKSIEGERDASPVSKLPEQRQAFLGQHLSLVIVALDKGESRSGKQRLRPQIRSNFCASFQRPPQEPQSLIAVTAHHPEALQRDAKA